jgi:hypothetical protein
MPGARSARVVMVAVTITVVLGLVLSAFALPVAD